MTKKHDPDFDRGTVRYLASELEIPSRLAEAGGATAAAAMAELKKAHIAGSGMMRANHVAEAQKHIAGIDQRQHSDLLQHLQAIVVTLGGKPERAELAHVTPGEIVIPAELRTPEVMAALRATAEAQGIDLERFEVGNRENSMNPKTGQAEFYYSPMEHPGIPATTQEPFGTQVADLYVNYFPKMANGAGHVGIGVNTPQTKGFYPADSDLVSQTKELFGLPVPGVIKDDPVSAPHETLRIPTTPEQDRAAQEMLDLRAGNPGNYQLYNDQCTENVAKALRAGQVDVPSDATVNFLDDRHPGLFFEALKKRYGNIK